jgi:hypothetical protein
MKWNGDAMQIPARRRVRRGAVIVYAALCLTILTGLAALTIDIGIKHDRLRHVRAAVDASALAGAADLFKYWRANQGADPNNTARNAVLSIAEANGYKHGANGVTVDISIPPISGQSIGKAGYVEVVITKQDRRYFSGIFGSDPLVTKSRAVARGTYSEVSDGIIVLDPSAKDSLNAHGGGNILIRGAPVVVDSNHTEAAITNGSVNSKVCAKQFRITGGYTQTGGSYFADEAGNLPAPILVGTRPEPDPLAYLPAPQIGNLPVGTITWKNQQGGGKTYTLTPGVHYGGLTFSGQDSVIMQPGIYYLSNCGFSMSGQGSLVADQVMIYNDPNNGNSANISITGSGVVRMSPPQNGTYMGVLVFQRRTADTTVVVSGSGQYQVSGTFYAANALVKISGNGDSYIGSQYISRLLDLGGTGALTIDYTASVHPGQRILQMSE